MSKFSNLLRLLVILKSKGRVKSKDIATSLDISERMVRKYINDLIDAGVNVQSIPGPNGGYEIEGFDYLLDTKITKDEFVAYKILRDKSTYESDNLKNYLESLEEKLNVQINMTKEYKDFSNNIVLSSKVNNLELQNNIELELYAAIIQRKKVRIEYTSVSSGVSERVIHPYKIVTRNNMKYILVYCEKKQKVITLKLVRFNKVDILEESFHLPEESKINELLKDNKLGVMGGEDINVKLLIKSPFSYSVRERIYSPNQVVTVNDDESIIFEATLNGKEEIIRWILSMRSYCTILDPMELKDDIIKELQKMLHIYKDCFK